MPSQWDNREDREEVDDLGVVRAHWERRRCRHQEGGLIRAAEFHTDLAESDREKVFRGDETHPRVTEPGGPKGRAG